MKNVIISRKVLIRVVIVWKDTA